jgi:hypothetical protein
VLQAAIPQKNFLLISKRLDLHIQVATRGCRQSGGNKKDAFIQKYEGGQEDFAGA